MANPTCYWYSFNPQGKALVEQAHATLKKQLQKIKKGGISREVMAQALLTLNFLSLLQGVPYTRDKHFIPIPKTLPFG